jgi:hypothetical protein
MRGKGTTRKGITGEGTTLVRAVRTANHRGFSRWGSLSIANRVPILTGPPDPTLAPRVRGPLDDLRAESSAAESDRPPLSCNE